MTALPDWDILSDAELAQAAVGGDRSAFAGIYDRYADRLHDFCVGMLRDRDAAADCVQDTFCTAADRMSQLREADKLRPWLYAIARNECLRCIRARGRERVYDDVPEVESAEPGPDAMAARSELATLVAEAAGGLSDRDRTVLELAYRHGLDGAELAEALGVSADSAKKMTQRLRETIERSLGALLVARGVRADPGACAELGEILNGWDGEFTVLMRKRIARHIESCSVCDEERRRKVNPVALLGGVPVFIKAPDWLRERTLDKIRLTASSTPADSSGNQDATQPAHAVHDAATHVSEAATDDAATAPIACEVPEEATRRSVLPAVLAGLALVALIVVCALWLTQRHVDVAPANVTQTQPPPPGQAPRLAPPSSQTPPPPSEGPITTTIPGPSTPPPPSNTPLTPTETPPPPAPPAPPRNGPSSYTSAPPAYTPSRPPSTQKPPPDTEEPSSSTPKPSGGGTKPPKPPGGTKPPTKPPPATPTSQPPIIY